MIENYINKILSNDESFCYKDGDRLREWQKDLAFYWSGESLKADYALVDKTPKCTKAPEIHTDGKFGSFSKIKSPIVFDEKNLQCLTDNLNLSFWLGANNINGYYTIYLTPKEDFKISAGDYSFSVQIDGGTSRQLRMNLKENASFSSIKNRLSFELDPNLYGVEVDLDQTTEDVIAIKSSLAGKKFSLIEGTDGIDFLSLVNHDEINYGTLPSEDCIEIIKLGNHNGSFTISHTREKDENKLLSKLRFTYKYGDTTKTTSIKWNNNGISLDHIEVDIDSSVMYIFLNGKLEKAVLISPIKREAEDTVLIINGTETDFYSIEELIIKSKLQNKENFKVSTEQMTHYDKSIPYIDYYFDGKKFGNNLKFDLVHNCSDGISMVLNYGGLFYYYSNGSWRQSDGTFKQSNDHYTFGDYLKNFNFNGTEDMFIRAFFESDGSDEQYIEKLNFDLSSDGIYEEGSKTAAVLVGIPTFEPETELHTKEDDYSDNPYPYDPSPDDVDPDSPEVGPYPYDPSPDDIELEEGETVDKVIDLKGKDLLIKTDLGTTKIAFPKDMTLDEAIKFIEDAFPEGISKIYRDSKYRIVLVSETKGDEAFIKVSGKAGDTLFGELKTAQGTDQSKNTLEDNYNKFIEDVKEYSSDDLIPIEIKDSQVRMYLQEAINLYKKYRNDELNTYQVQLKGNATDGYEIPSVVQDWHDITDILFRPLFPLGFYTGSFDNDAEDIIELSLVNSIGGVDYSQFYGKGFQTDYYISLMNIESMEQILGLTPSWRVYNNRLYIFPNNISKYCTVTIVYKAPIDPIKALREPYIIQYVYGKIRMAQGEVRGQYGSQLSSGGLAMQFNADTMYERGKEAVEKAIEEMKRQQEPLGFIVG